MGKKILIGVTSYKSYVLLKGSLNYYSKNDFEVHLVCSFSENLVQISKENHFHYHPIKIERNISVVKDFVSLFSLLRLIFKIKPDVICVGTPKMALLGVISGRLLNINKVIYLCRGFRFYHEKGLKKVFLKNFEYLTFLFAKQILFIAPSLLEYSITNFNLTKSKFTCINPGSSNGIDLEYFDHEKTYPLKDEKLIGFLKQKSYKNVITFCGRIVRRKGFEELFLAFKKLSRNDTLLLFIGDVEENQVNNLMVIDEMSSHPDVYITGFVEDVRPYIKLGDIFCVPAYWEGFGNVFIQASALGLPVIAGDSLGCVDAVDNGFSGLLVKPESVEDLYEVLSDLIDDADLQKELSQNGIKHVQKFSQKLVWNQYIKIFNQN